MVHWFKKGRVLGMEIGKVSIIGLGALGILFGNYLSKKMPKGNLRVVADRVRIQKYRCEGIFCNGECCDFHYVLPEEATAPADLVIFAVKDGGLDDAVQAMRNQIGENTIIISALNGITSEEIIGKTYGMDNILYCVAQGMDAVKVGNKLTYENMGMLCFGDREPGIISEKTKAVTTFFEQVGLPFEIDKHMHKRLWGKFMLNVGVNQTVAIFQSNYGEIQKEGRARDMMIAAMREVIALSNKEGVHLTEADLTYWLDILSTLSPQGKPSMAQDVEAKRYSEVELFAGAVIEFGKKHGIQTPVNQQFYERIKEMESEYRQGTA
jgi:2-dehydropantoate 2-reductase